MDARARDMASKPQPAEASVVESISSEFSAWREWAQEQQQTWLEKLGDHEYHFIDKQKSLEMKVGFALYGLPSESTNLYLYPKDQCEYIAKISSKISEESKKLNPDGIYFSVLFIYCFTEESKFKFKFWENEEKEASMFQNVVFKIGKGPESKEMKFIDTHLRVYDSWNSFKVDNVYQKCWYVLPKDGKYQKDLDSRVAIEFEMSPEWTFKRELLNKLDTGGIVVGLSSTVVMAASVFVPVATPVIIGSIVAGGVGGAYSAGRSIGKLVDRHTHKQSINPMEKEALFVWIELSLGVFTVGMSACSVVSSLQAAAAATGEAAASAATAGGEVATSASGVTKGSGVAAKGSKAAAKAASKLGNGTKVASTGSKAASAATSGTNMGKATTNLGKGAVDGTAKATKATKNVADVGQKAAKAANAASKTSKIAKSAVNVGSNASKAADGVAKVIKVSKNVADVGQKAAKVANAASKTSKVAKSAADVGSNASKAADGLAKVTKATKNVADVGKKAAKVANAASKTSKVAKSAVDVGSNASKAADGVAKVTKVSKNVADVGQKAAKVANAASKTSKVAKSAADVGSNASKAADGVAKVTKATKNVPDVGQKIINGVTKSSKALKNASDLKQGATNASKVAKVGKCVAKTSRAVKRARKAAKMTADLGSKSSAFNAATFTSTVVEEEITVASKFAKLFNFASLGGIPSNSSSALPSTATTGASKFETFV